jgi:hypothetical protein
MKDDPRKVTKFLPYRIEIAHAIAGVPSLLFHDSSAAAFSGKEGAMGMLWREELENLMPVHPRRLNVVHVLREESEVDEPDYLLDEEQSDTDEGDCYPHLIPAERRGTKEAVSR